MRRQVDESAGWSMTRVIVVTGGASGLGEAIVSRFASDNDLVVVADVDELRARQVADNLTAAGLPAESETVDVTSEGEVAAMFDAIAERHGRLDGLVCAAAVDTRSSLVDCTDEQWQQVLDVNVKGPFLCCKHGIPAIAGSGGGAVVLLGSVLGEIGSPGYAAYRASKGALASLAQQAAIEHAPERVRVNVVEPSATDTGLGTAAEVAATVAFLCSNGAAFLSGAIIPLDAGMAARRII
jgi:meso-butanediol dehydrogenase / (S,S)-butanediol dehydrogenase / diacetyl reductase